MTRIDAHRSFLSGAGLLALGRMRGYGSWKHLALNRSLTHARVRKAVASSRLDAVLAVGDVEPILGLPTFLYQDANFSVARAHSDLLSDHAPALIRFPAGRLDELIGEQRAAYRAATTVLSFSQWFADWLVEHDGLPADRVCVVGAGLHALPARRDLEVQGAGGTRVLFVGREFFRKGGELVVAAVERLRATGAGDFTLTVAGPSSWPLASPVPEWVRFLGEVSAGEVGKLWAEHDLFALPSWYEPYGLVFLEARAAGVPALARDAYCMPELVPVESGRLIPGDAGVDAVAEQLLSMSQDAELYVSTASAAAEVRSEHTWEAVAARVSRRVSDALGLA